MIKNVCKVLRKVFSCEEGDCIGEDVTSSQGASEEGIFTFENNIIIPEDVSEPVISFVKCFKENPKRFKVSNTASEYIIEGCSDKVYYNIFTDLVTGDVFKGYYFDLRELLGVYIYEGERKFALDLSDNELKLLGEVITDYSWGRNIRKNRILQVRKDRVKRDIRKRLTKIYKGGE